ncbi:replication initiation protein [Rubrimonas sp.]|uniref:replication initiation protein n=1 Tax=Rubrimonas sp. TaxID=2036015 RepID=UPI002FDDD061
MAARDGATGSATEARETLRGALRRESVKKNVAAIHVSGKLSLLQRKLANVLLLNAYDGLLSRRSHVIDARTLCVMIGYNSNDTDTLKEALRALVETTAEWDMLNDDGGREWGVSALLASARLRNGVCEYAYSPALAEKLHDPKIFALINLSIQREFSSGHALALYENCYRFVRTGSTGWWEIEIFRRLMGVHDSAYYRNFKHLNAKIIKPAVAEVNAVSNIVVSPEFRRQGRVVSHVRFLMREIAQGPVVEHGVTADDETAALRDRMRALGVSDRLARQWLDEHGAPYVAEKLDYVAAAARRGRVRGSPVGYLSAALRDDWRVSVPSPARRTAPAPARVAAASAEAARETLATLRRTHRVACFDAVEALVAARNPTQRDADRRQFLRGVRDEVDREDFRRRGWRSAVNTAAIFAFWERIAPGMLPRLEAIAEDQGLDLAALRAAAAE